MKFLVIANNEEKVNNSSKKWMNYYGVLLAPLKMAEKTHLSISAVFTRHSDSLISSPAVTRAFEETATDINKKRKLIYERRTSGSVLRRQACKMLHRIF